MKFSLILFVLLFAQITQAQNTLEKVYLTLRYPSENTEYDNITFNTAQPVLHEDLDLPYPYYELKKKNWEPGQIFQLKLLKNTLPSGYFYVFGVDETGELSLYYPDFPAGPESTESATSRPPLVIPSPRRGINLVKPGLHQICVLFFRNICVGSYGKFWKYL